MSDTTLKRSSVTINYTASDGYRSADARRWLLAYVLEFDDDGEPEGAILHRGTEEECERLASMLPAVAYNGPRNVLRASMRWAPEPPND